MLKTKDALVSDTREAMRGGKGAVTLTHAVQANESGVPAKLRVMAQITVPPGASVGYHVHENETEVFHFIEGVARITDDDAVYEAHPGDVVVTASGHGHAVENVGEGTLRFTAVVVLD